MTMKIAAALTVALVAVVGLAVADDFNNFNNFNDFDDNSAFFGPSFGGASLAGPAFSSGVGLGGGVGGFSGGFAAPSFVPLPAPQASSGLGLTAILPIFFLLFIILLGSSGSPASVVVINSTLTGSG